MFDPQTPYDHHHRIVSKHLDEANLGIIYLMKKKHAQEWMESGTMKMLEKIKKHISLAHDHQSAIHDKCKGCRDYPK